MPVVSADSLQLAIVEEASAGVTPATPSFKLFRTSGESLSFSPNVSESAELGTGGRSQKPGNVTGMVISGDINFELAPHPALEDAIAGVLASDWGVCPLTGAADGNLEADRITVGQALKTFTIEKRFTNPATVTGTMTIGLVVDAPAASVDLTFSGAATTGTGVAVVLLAVDSGTVEKFEVPIGAGDDNDAVKTSAIALIDASATFDAVSGGVGIVTVTPATGTALTTSSGRIGADSFFYQRFVGSSFSVLNLDTSPNNPVTGSVTVVGGVPELDVLPIAGATYASAGSSAVCTAPEVMELSVGAALGIGTNCWTSLGISLDSNNRGISCLGTQGDREVVLGTLGVSITGDVYFSDQAILEALLNNETLGDGVITFTNADGDIYRFDVFGAKPVAGEVAAGGQGEDLTIPLELQATPQKVCDDGAGTDWEASFILSKVNTAPPAA